MLNVEAVQKNVSNLVIEFAKKRKKDKWAYWDVYDTSYSEYLPNTCSALEMSTPNTDKSLANTIAKALLYDNKYIQCSVTTRSACNRLEKFGFKKVTSYMGNHGSKVHVYFLNLTGYKF